MTKEEAINVLVAAVRAGRFVPTGRLLNQMSSVRSVVLTRDTAYYGFT